MGPGFKKAFLPGYPKRKDSLVLQTDVEGRTVTEIDFYDAPKIGRFHAVDYFGDGSLYILDSPGVSALFLPCLSYSCFKIMLVSLYLDHSDIALNSFLIKDEI